MIIYACTACNKQYDEDHFVDAIMCCEGIDKHGENYYMIDTEPVDHAAEKAAELEAWVQAEQGNYPIRGVDVD